MGLLTIPKSYTPKKNGRKFPKEDAIYATKAEQRALLEMTDGKAERGPRGLLSFRLDDDDRADIKASTGGFSSFGGSSGGGWSNNPNPFSGDNKKDTPTRSNMAVSRPGSYAGPKGAVGLNEGARMAVARGANYNMPDVNRALGDAEAMGRMMMAESRGIKNPQGGINTTAMQGVGDVIRNRMLSDRYGPTTAQGIMAERSKKGTYQFSPMKDGSYAKTKPDYSATAVAESILSGETPSVVGGALNYGNLDTINQKPGYSSSRTKAAFNAMQPLTTFASAYNPGLQHTFGTQGTPSDVNLFGPARPEQIRMASAQPMSAPPAPQQPMHQAQPIPAPSTGGWFDTLKAKVGTGLQQANTAFTDANKQINALPGGAKMAVTASKIMQALGNIGTGDGKNFDKNAWLRGNGQRDDSDYPELVKQANMMNSPPVVPPPAVNPVPPMTPPPSPWLYPQYSQSDWAMNLPHNGRFRNG